MRKRDDGRGKEEKEVAREEDGEGEGEKKPGWPIGGVTGEGRLHFQASGWTTWTCKLHPLQHLRPRVRARAS